ncbi:Glycoside hydrolase, family 1 [Corchorus olitorius]|uniref:Glycoside hydrolase, family 1 n=1 Tax=Corchorus olitorius TaxID=93759 RepID=A0A1R3GN35_9ROSI|nr:Glycoside hydrolase, family 1 [Corchorus olitorius]
MEHRNKVQPTQYNNFSRNHFPKGFIFGAGVSAYQVEGAAHEDGKGESVWDYYAKKYPGRILDNSSGDVAVDFYHKYKEDIKLMKKIGLDSFRFSISWARVLPSIKPFVTLLHFDHPQALQEEYGGFNSRKFVVDFAQYADFCFKTFGDRVKYWATINEPNGWIVTILEPNAAWIENKVGPFELGHNLILAHAHAVQIYRRKYQATQKGKIGITINTSWYKPLNSTNEQEEAAKRALDFNFGWFVNPIMFGEYPKIMRDLLGKKLPHFTAAEAKQIKGSVDFLGVNYYSASYASYDPFNESKTATYLNYANVTLSSSKGGVPIGTETALGWLYLVPKGLKELVIHIKEKYNNPVVYIHENGVPESNNASLSVTEAIKDSLRITALDGHLKALLEGIKAGANVKGYYMWSFLDNYEWNHGYTIRFGMVYVDFKQKLQRHLKYSAYWFKKFLRH